MLLTVINCYQCYGKQVTPVVVKLSEKKQVMAVGLCRKNRQMAAPCNAVCMRSLRSSSSDAVLMASTYDTAWSNALHCSGNPLEEKHSAEGDWKDQVATRLKKLKKLDGE